MTFVPVTNFGPDQKPVSQGKPKPPPTTLRAIGDLINETTLPDHVFAPSTDGPSNGRPVVQQPPKPRPATKSFGVSFGPHPPPVAQVPPPTKPRPSRRNATVLLGDIFVILLFLVLSSGIVPSSSFGPNDSKPVSWIPPKPKGSTLANGPVTFLGLISAVRRASLHLGAISAASGPLLVAH